MDEFKNIFKPFRYTKKGNITILESTSGNFVVKDKSKDLKDIFNYLKSRNFDSFPKLIENNRSDVNVFEYIEDNNIIYPQKSEDLIKLVALLHSKTSYYKEVSTDSYQEVYENIDNNINYYKNYYKTQYELYLKSRYMSPHEYAFVRNYSKITASLLFAENELTKWYDNYQNNDKERVALIHNNLELEHFIRKDNEDYLISWDKAKFDSPVIDLVNFYRKEFFNIEFSSIFKTYMNSSPLNDQELKLFFILISLPDEITFEGSSFNICKNMREKLDYVFKTEQFLAPYYTEDTKEEQE